MSEHFFSRWSKRKQAVAKGLPAEEAPPPSSVQGAAPLNATPADAKQQALTSAGPQPNPAREATANPKDAPAQALPTMDDTKVLTPASDFQPFMQQGVAADVRNAAVKKLFSDPHFNVMDGLDIYIGDYNTPDPLPAGMLEKMVGAQLLNLFSKTGDTAVVDKGGQASQVFVPSGTEPSPAAPEASPVVAQSPQSQINSELQTAPALQATEPSAHDHTDLQLQPNHAPASPSTGPSTG